MCHLFFQLPSELVRSKEPIEFPRILSPSLMIKEIPFGSGYFIGFFGLNIQWFIKRVNIKKKPAIFFIHPWQIKEPPKIKSNLKGNLLNQFKMIPYNINRRDTFNFLCENYQFTSMIKLINTYGFNTEKPGF